MLEAVGHMPAYEQAYGIVRPGRVISRVGVPQYEDAPVGFASLFGKNATLTGGPATIRAYLEAAIPQVLDGSINPGRVFDRELPLDDIAEAYRRMDARNWMTSHSCPRPAQTGAFRSQRSPRPPHRWPAGRSSSPGRWFIDTAL